MEHRIKQVCMGRYGEDVAASESGTVTRRGIVSAVYSLFDPLGFIEPYAMKVKLLLQTLSRKKLGWNYTTKKPRKNNNGSSGWMISRN